VKEPNWPTTYLSLHPLAALKILEHPYVYHVGRDELYEIDNSALSFLCRCDGSLKGIELTSDAQFVEFCLDEGLLESLPQPNPISIPIGNAPIPSLRYLELQLTNRCNLRCRHCYLGPARSDDLPLHDALNSVREFSIHGGLRLLISGGEPLLYPHLEEFIAATGNLQIRRVLITNGTLITEKNVSGLDVEEIQFSLDGWRSGHEVLRGPGSFEHTMRGIQTVCEAGIPISIATMIHRGNISEFKQLAQFTKEIGATEWGVDVPCMAGSLRQNQDLSIPYEDAAKLMKYAYGGGYHGSSEGFACGRHLMAITPTGKALKCGFYADAPLGDACHGLIACWLNLKHIQVTALECKGCPVIEDCCGGCRFRASHPMAPDLVMCALYGIEHKASTSNF
jgi:radical SAM protein with 4Fe4S-binding SPASM domain